MLVDMSLVVNVPMPLKLPEVVIMAEVYSYILQILCKITSFSEVAIHSLLMELYAVYIWKSQNPDQL